MAAADGAGVGVCVFFEDAGGEGFFGFALAWLGGVGVFGCVLVFFAGGVFGLVVRAVGVWLGWLGAGGVWVWGLVGVWGVAGLFFGLGFFAFALLVLVVVLLLLGLLLGLLELFEEFLGFFEVVVGVGVVGVEFEGGLVVGDGVEEEGFGLAEVVDGEGLFCVGGGFVFAPCGLEQAVGQVVVGFCLEGFVFCL